jgi:hypothetical protein
MCPSTRSRASTSGFLSCKFVCLRVGVCSLGWLWQTRNLYELLPFSPRHLQSAWIRLPSLTLLLLQGEIVYRYERVESVDRIIAYLDCLHGWCVECVSACCGISSLVEVKDATLLFNFRRVHHILSLCTSDCSLILFRLEDCRQLCCNDICRSKVEPGHLFDNSRIQR